MVVRHFVGPTHAACAFKRPAQIAFCVAGRRREVAHPWRTEALRPAEKRRDRFPRGFVLGRELRLVRRQSDERAIQNELAQAGKLSQGDVERRLRQFRLRMRSAVALVPAPADPDCRCDRRRSARGWPTRREPNALGSPRFSESPDSKMTSPSLDASSSRCSAESARSRANSARSKANGGASKSAGEGGRRFGQFERCALLAPLWRPPPSRLRA